MRETPERREKRGERERREKRREREEREKGRRMEKERRREKGRERRKGKSEWEKVKGENIQRLVEAVYIRNRLRWREEEREMGKE